MYLPLQILYDISTSLSTVSFPVVGLHAILFSDEYTFCGIVPVHFTVHPSLSLYFIMHVKFTPNMGSDVPSVMIPRSMIGAGVQ
jgi:hypothetical protein